MLHFVRSWLSRGAWTTGLIVGLVVLPSCAHTPEVPASYRDLPSMRAFDALLPSALRLDEDRPPLERFWPWRDYAVHIDEHEPDAPPRGVVIVVHGAGGNGRLFGGYAQLLARSGYRVLAPDLPGYGLTRVPAHARPRLADWVDLVADLADEQARAGQLPVFVLGGSLGGTTALYAGMKSDAIRGVVATTLLDLRDAETMRAIAACPLAVGLLPLIGATLDDVELEVRRLAPLEKMAREPALASWFADDPLIGRRRVRVGFFRSLSAYEPPTPFAAFDRPVLLIHPAKDTWTPVNLSRPIFDALAGPKRLVLLPEAGHLPVEPEALTVLEREVVSFLSEHGPASVRSDDGGVL